ncbi:MAG TPA: DUF5724 domain-containing protein, partial [Armatimonadota bacterium]|nr:DUF5724 domain-containing protein [Armatimonadota bacterium]
HILSYLSLATVLRVSCPERWTDAHATRFWGLVRWMDEPVVKAEGETALQPLEVPRQRPEWEEVLVAFQAGAATEADVIDQLLGRRDDECSSTGGYYSSWFGDFRELRHLTGRKADPRAEKYPFLPPLVDRCRRRIIQVELDRGDTPTAASAPALALRRCEGLDTLLGVLRALGSAPFIRGWTDDGLSKASVFSHLTRSTFPTEADTHGEFAERARAAGLSETRLVEVAVYAPQWAGHVEHALGWPGLASGVWWVHAHTKDVSWTVDGEIREVWNAEVNEYTPLTGQDLLDGAVDVAWFHRVYGMLGPDHWKALDQAARYASGGGGHKRAQLFADAMLGRVGRAELLQRIAEKRHQDSLRALGLHPLPDAPEARDKDLLERYRVIQEFVRASRQFGSMRQASEKRAAQIGMENLARTAGYPDPVRLSWAMEARGVADLADGPLIVTVGDVALTLSIDESGRPELSVLKAGKPLKSLPEAVKKDPEATALRARVVELKRQASRMRVSLEEAMCRGDAFTGAELRELLAHPILSPMLQRLVLIGHGEGTDAAGYPLEGGTALLDYAGTTHPINPGDVFRIAHPHDLFLGGAWEHWQRECFRSERIQPFKQVFRELYVLTETERPPVAERESGAEGVGSAVSLRYAGHQVQPRQALALLSSRGWVNHPEEGVRRTFHALDLSVHLELADGTFTPAEVEGLTLEGIRFTRRGDWRPIDLALVPPRIFSEVMRDVDLVVSVAHRGGVDPEASASTVEMRASLLRETCALLNLSNVRVQGTHSLIEGGLGSYSVHLGSAVVHRQPGGHLCVVAVPAQHRGRLFLPFADDDPRTAEVMSKVLLLARDTEIRDPNILDQIRAA